MATQTTLASGLAGAIGSDLRRTRNQLVFVEFGGRVSAVNLLRSATVVSFGTTLLKGTWSLDLEDGSQLAQDPANDIFWEQQTDVERQMRPRAGVGIVNLGVVDFNSITPSSLQQLPYSSTPINGDDNATNKLVAGDVFAVRTNKGHYAKVKVLAYGYNINLQWVTYALDPAYVVLGTGYQQPEDVKVSGDDIHAYVTERTGNLLKVKLSNANRASATVVASGMTAPHQIVLDEPRGVAYVVEFAPSGRLWRIDLASGAKHAVLSGLESAVGLALSADLQYAFVSEQTTGPDKGRVSRVRLSDGTRTLLRNNLTAPFFLTWADAARTTLLVPERDPSNRVLRVDATAGGAAVVASGMPSRPSSAVLISSGQMLVCCNESIVEVELALVIQPAGPLFMGIGFIPFDKVKPSGLADTSVDPAYFYQVKDTPFGGRLPIMVNHQRAFNEGAAYYRIRVDGTARTDSWTDYRWNGFQYVVQTTAPTVVGGQPGHYPVHSLAELFLWMNPSLGGMVDSTNLSNGLHTIVLDFTNGAGGVIASTAPLTIRVNNQSCIASLSPPVLNGSSASAVCGVLTYTTKNADPVTMGFSASHPANFATFSFSLVKGVNPVPLPAAPPTSGPVSSAVSPFSATVADLMGTCNVAGFAEGLYVAATINNGWNRQSQYDASAMIAFVLAP